MAKQDEKIAKKSKLPTKKYPLIKAIKIRGKLRAIGEKVDLTEEGRKYFQSKFYIE